MKGVLDRGSTPLTSTIRIFMNTIIYQFEDGKIFYIEKDDGKVLINIVHKDQTVANKVYEKILMEGVSWFRQGNE